jgi:hypothetical protein
VPLEGRDIQRREAIIDADAVPLIEGGKAHWATGGAETGFVGYWSADVGQVPLRRLIMNITDSDLNVRHLNGDPLDCRRENLVVRTVKQRSWNAKKIRSINGRAPTSDFKGVYWDKRTKQWRAGIKAHGKDYKLGRFGSEVAAAEAYDEMARELFGEHAYLNFPDGIDAWLQQQAEELKAEAGERKREAA